MSEAATAFIAGFASRQSGAASRLEHVFQQQPPGFSPAGLIARIEEAFASKPPGPREEDPAASAADIAEPVAAPVEPIVEAAPIDPIAVARDDGFQAGYAAARAEIDAAAVRDRALLDQVAQALRSDDRIDRERVARQLRQTVLHLVTRIVGETGISADLLVARVAAAAELLAEANESAILRVHPDDVALLAGRLPDTIFAIGDAAIARGAFLLESASTMVEDGPELWLQQLTGALDRVAVPSLADPIAA